MGTMSHFEAKCQEFLNIRKLVSKTVCLNFRTALYVRRKFFGNRFGEFFEKNFLKFQKDFSASPPFRKNLQKNSKKRFQKNWRRT